MNQSKVYRALCVHWDHHPESETQRYGAGTDAGQIRSYLRAVRPDVTQYHTIGAPGYASFPSTVAPVVPGLVGDPLRVWSQVCAEEGVSFGCYAASFAARSPTPTPQWRCVNRAGAVSPTDYCPNTAWTEEFFTPFLFEIMDRYHPAHFWLDGVWLPGSRVDYCFCERCQERFHSQYGRALPKEPAPADWIDLQEFYERSLDEAIGRIGRAIKQRDPAISLACNYAYFFKDLRRPAPEVDWLSWDALNTPDLHRASFEATYLNTAGKPADIMIYEMGIVRWQPELLRRPRPIAQVKSEAATILAHGARVNFWHDPNPDGSISSAKACVAQPLAEFVRARQDWCVDNESAAEVAVLASRLDHCVDPGRQDVIVRAAQQLLQEAHIPCDVVRDDILLNRLVHYRLIVLPEVKALNLDTAQWLHQYVTDGGSLLMIAAAPALDAAPWLDALLGPDVAIEPTPQLAGAAMWHGQPVVLGHRRFRLAGKWRSVIPYADMQDAWLVELTLGEGCVLAITGEALSDYAETHWPPLRDLVAAALREASGPEALAEMEGNPGVEMVVNRRGKDLYVHLVNLTPGACFGAASEVFFDSAPVYYDLEITLRPPHAPTAVVLLPDNCAVQPLVDGNVLRVVVPELHHHVALQLVNAADDRSG